jgi:hypothetical protein
VARSGVHVKARGSWDWATSIISSSPVIACRLRRNLARSRTFCLARRIYRRDVDFRQAPSRNWSRILAIASATLKYAADSPNLPRPSSGPPFRKSPRRIRLPNYSALPIF